MLEERPAAVVFEVKMLIVCDFDGTVTASDTNSALARRFAPARVEAFAGKLARREVTVRETLANEFDGLAVPLDDLVEAAVDIPVRPGFRELVDGARAAGGDVVLLSSGFRQIIEPVLAREGLDGLVELLANDLVWEDGALRTHWRELPMCERCDEHCKRHEVALLKGGMLHPERGAFEQIVFVGDGFSDRCGADVADRIFARDSLAHWLDEQGVAWEAWNDFFDIARALGLERASEPTHLDDEARGTE